jgi:CheY-like chemotaxis protein
MAFVPTILCIDDDPDDRQAIREVVEQHHRDFALAEAGNGQEALHYLEEACNRGELPCLIIMDVNMPRMDGRRTIELIHADPRLRPIPLVVFTTSANPADKLYFEHYRVHYTTKPSHFKAFAREVEHLLDTYPAAVG